MTLREEREREEQERAKRAQQEKPVVLTLEEASEKIVDLTKSQGKPSPLSWLVLFISVLAFLLGALAVLRPVSVTPKTAAPSAEVAALRGEVSTLQGTVSAFQDSLTALRQRFNQTEEQSASAIGMIEQRAQDLDDFQKRIHRLEMTTASK